MKNCARRFTFSASGVVNYYIACDLDEGILRYWETLGKTDYIKLLFSNNKDERTAAYEIFKRAEENESCRGYELNEAQIERIEGLLSAKNIESMRGLTNEEMGKRSQYCCYRDGWSSSFYAEGDAGWPPLMLEGISWCSSINDELPFELLESYVGSEVLNNRCKAFP